MLEGRPSYGRGETKLPPGRASAEITMANRLLRLDYEELPRLLKAFVNNISVCAEEDGTLENGPGKTIDEREYYSAFESLLQYRRYRDNDGSINSSVDMSPVCPAPLTKRQHQELIDFHLKRVLSAWVFDHAAHKKYAYYPSNAYPMGSTMEYSFFTRQWIRNVNYPHVRRLYDRSGDFDQILSCVNKDLCPCSYLVQFNVFDQFEYKLENIQNESSENEQGGKVLCLLEIENELMMRSEFFNKRKEYYTVFNMWFYDQFLDPSSDMYNALQTETKAVFMTHSDYDNDSAHREGVFGEPDKAIFYRHWRCKTRAKKRPTSASITLVEEQTSPSSTNLLKHKRLQQMSEVSSRLLFGQTTYGPILRQLLVRCEDYTSCLYSPKLKVTSCRHTEEDVTFEQRRCGDEIKTEIRTCKKCGKVKVIAN